MERPVTKTSMLKTTCTAQQMKFTIKDFFGKCDQIRGKLQSLSYLMKKSWKSEVNFCEFNLFISVINTFVTLFTLIYFVPMLLFTSTLSPVNLKILKKWEHRNQIGKSQLQEYSHCGRSYLFSSEIGVVCWFGWFIIKFFNFTSFIFRIDCVLARLNSLPM